MQNKKPNNSLLYRYLGLGTQLLVAIGLMVFLGIKIDGRLQLQTPMLVWILPLLVIVVSIYKIVKDTSPKQD